MNSTSIVNAAFSASRVVGIPSMAEAMAVYMLRTVCRFSFERIAHELEISANRRLMLQAFNRVSVARFSADPAMVRALQMAAELTNQRL